MSMDLTEFINKKAEEVRKFCVEDLAGVLYSCVEHCADPRDHIDWFTAEEFINAQTTYAESISTAREFVQLSAYEELRRRLKNTGFELIPIKRSDGSCWATDQRGYIISDRDTTE